MTTLFRAWAESRRYRIRRGTGEPIRGGPYGPDPGDEYVPLARGYMWDASSPRTATLAIGIVVFGRKLARYIELARKLGARTISASDEDLLFLVPSSALDESCDRILRPLHRKIARILSPEQKAVLRVGFGKRRRDPRRMTMGGEQETASRREV